MRSMESYQSRYRTVRARWTGWTGRLSSSFGMRTRESSRGEVATSWNTTARMAFGRSRKATSITRCKMGICALNGETSRRRKARSWQEQGGGAKVGLLLREPFFESLVADFASHARSEEHTSELQ